MRDSKLYKALVDLSGHELNRLHRFVNSPYFNRNQPAIRLFDWLREDLRKPGQGAETGKETIWTICYPDEAFDDGRFRKLQSDLLKLIEDFYAQEAFEANPVHKAKYLLESIYEKGLERLKGGALKTALHLVEDQNLRPASYYYFRYEIEQSIYELNRLDQERNTKSNIELIAQNLDRFYLAEKLRYYCTILNHQLLAALDYKMLFIDEIIQHVEQNDYQDVAPILVYHQILLTYRYPDNEDHYEKLKSLIYEHIGIFPESEAKEIIDAALNYGINKMNSGVTRYLREVFELYKVFLDKSLLQYRGVFDPFHFKNIVTIGLRLGEYDWVEKFITSVAPALADNVRENAITFNLAQLNFYKRDYSKVIFLLSQVEYEDITYNLNSKTLLMASYFELDELDALNSLLDTFRVYLNRNKKIPATRRKHYLNTISIVRKLARIRPGEKKEIEKLHQEIEATQGIVSKNWILEKLDNLK